MFKKFLQSKGISDEAFKAMEVEKQAELHGEYLGQLETRIEGAAKNEDVTALKNQINDLKEKGATADQIKELTEKLDNLATQWTEVKTISGKSGASFKEEFGDFLSKNAEELKGIVSRKAGVIEFTPKAVASITTASGTNTSAPAITGTQMAPLKPVNLRTDAILGMTTQFSTDEAAYPYTEAKPKEGAVTSVAEGGTKPQIDLLWDTKYATPVKVAAWMKLTEEAVKDVRNLQSIADDFLRKQVALKKANLILFGDGTSPNPKGASVYARAFSAGSLATAVTAPNFMDVVNAAVTDIATTHNFTDETPYMATNVFVSYTDFFTNLVAAKDGQGHPLYPTASLFGQVNIGGITIYPYDQIPAGKILVCDMTKYNTTDYVPYTVKIGWVNDDFIKNQFVILGEERFHAFVKKLDEQAFIYDDIATIKDAIDIANAA
jgi:hypothetical protein